MLYVAGDQTVPTRADLARGLIRDRGDVEAPLAKAVILDERAAHPPRPDQNDAIPALETKDVADATRQFRDGVAEAAFAERAEEGEVFAHLCGRRPSQASQLSGRNGGRLGLLQEAKVDGQPPARAGRERH